MAPSAESLIPSGRPSRDSDLAASTQGPGTLPLRLETLLEMNRQLSRIQPLDLLLGKMAEACGALLGADSVGIRVLDGDELVLTGVFGQARAERIAS
jgi:hypothetical protein